MKKTGLLVILLMLSLFCRGQQDVSPTHLQCEMLTNPLGIDVLQPRLSWQLQTQKAEVEQTGYRILVATTQEQLDANQGDLWDSGKVESQASVNIVYAGKTLDSRDEAFWKVKLWTNTGETTWSKPALWSMGILTYA